MQRKLLPRSHGMITVARQLLRIRNRHYAFIDLIIFLLTPALALYLRTDYVTSLRVFLPALLIYTGVALVVRMGAYYAFGLYQRYWRFAGAIDFAELTLASSVALLITVALYLALQLLPGFNLPRSVPLIDAMIALLAVGAVRTSLRLTETLRNSEQQPLGPAPKAQQRVLLVGAGYTGALLAREIRDNAYIHIRPVGFVDDDRNKQGM